jgi:glycosyltransferase involved in cell wall biosynthesis
LKRVELLVDAFAQLRSRGIPARLLLVGASRDDDDRPIALQAALASCDPGDRILVTGATTDVRPYLWAGDVFVLPSDREGLSNSILEALATGLPVIAPPSAAGDQVLDGACGIVPPTNEPAQLCHALTVLARDPEFRARLRVGARDVAERFALTRVVDDYERLYSRLQRRAAVH